VHSVSEAIGGLPMNIIRFDFLDIQLSDGLSFEILERSKSKVQ
jgi:hypothetical protein